MSMAVFYYDPVVFTLPCLSFNIPYTYPQFDNLWLIGHNDLSSCCKSCWTSVFRNSDLPVITLLIRIYYMYSHVVFPLHFLQQEINYYIRKIGHWDMCHLSNWDMSPRRFFISCQHYFVGWSFFFMIYVRIRVIRLVFCTGLSAN